MENHSVNGKLRNPVCHIFKAKLLKSIFVCGTHNSLKKKMQYCFILKSNTLH